MPVDLTKINTPKKQSVSYFHHALTGIGGKIGLFNNRNSVINQNIATYLYLNSNQKTATKKVVNLDITSHIDLKNAKLNQQRNLVLASTFIPNEIENYRKNAHHSFDLSPLSILAQYKTTLKSTRFTNLPHFINDVELTPIANFGKDHTLSIGLIEDRIDYYRYLNQTDPTKKRHLYELHSNLVIKLDRPNAKRTTVDIIKPNDKKLPNLGLQDPNHKNNQIIIITDIDLYASELNFVNFAKNANPIFTKLQNQLPLTLINSQQPSVNIGDTIIKTVQKMNVATIIRNQADINHRSLLSDLPTLFKFLNDTENQFENHRNILTNAYHLIKLEEPQYKESDYQRFYNQIKYQTLKHQSHNPLHQYKQFNFNKLISVNTRLSLTHQIGQLKNNQATYQFKPKTPVLKTTEEYSNEQLAIIHTTAPYSVGIAGAGSGKSHTLLGRLEFLKQNDIDFTKVLVTSFTNTAAQNIINRFKSGINSLTNANLFHKIYQANFDHQLTNDLTLTNLLSMISSDSKLMKSNDTINSTRLQLAALIEKNISGGFKKVDPRKVTENLIALINENLTDVITILNAINETSLLLEPIIINALMQNQSNINYPTELNNLNFIITDESQDTSAFEYVLLLQLAKLNNAQLMIMGDANQTLYEFRNANPEFLNTLERSDVFKTYTMSTNYRSKQSVLTMANEFLNVLKTNETAKIKLHANKYDHITLQQFKNDIQLENLIIKPETRKREDVDNEMVKTLETRQDFVGWVLDQYQNKNQIAIMAYRNHDTQTIGRAVQEIISQQLNRTATVGYTRTPTAKPNTWLSQMLSKTYDAKFKALATSGHLTAHQVVNSLKARLQVIANKRNYDKGVINNWALTQLDELTNRQSFKASLRELNQNKRSYNSFVGFINLWLIKAETYKNNTARLINNNKDQPDWQDCDIVVSTIHSAKGLEFDSVICYFDENTKSATSQENLRLFGVALTRAKKKELILNKPRLDKSKSIGQSVPSSFGYEESDMFKTPMRTANMRVIQTLKKVNKK